MHSKSSCVGPSRTQKIGGTSSNLLLGNSLGHRQGYTAEEVAPALEAAEAKVGLLQKDLKDLRKMRQVSIRQLSGVKSDKWQVANDEYKSRKLWWTEMRGHLGVQARCSFTVYMSQRDLNGRLDFDHTNDKLAIIVC